MSSENDPLTTAQVEDGFAQNEWGVNAKEEEEPRRESFRRWLAEHDQQVRVEHEERRAMDPILIENIDGKQASAWHTAEIAAAYRRGLDTALEILSAEATSASYHGWKSADEEFMKLHKKIRQEIQHPMLDRMTGNPKAEGRYDDEQ